MMFFIYLFDQLIHAVSRHLAALTAERSSPGRSSPRRTSCPNSGLRRRRRAAGGPACCSRRRSRTVRPEPPNRCRSVPSVGGGGDESNDCEMLQSSQGLARVEAETLSDIFTLILRLVVSGLPRMSSCLRSSLFSRSKRSNSRWYFSCTFINSSCIFSIFCCISSGHRPVSKRTNAHEYEPLRNS